MRLSWKFRSSVWVILATVSGVVGCGQSDPPAFRLNMPEIVTNQIVPQHQQEIADVLAALFGTPDEPFVLDEMGLDLKKLRMAAGPAESYEPGKKRGLYRQHCAHCHGVSGDGQGPTALFLNPYPRDYRKGVYKFKSTYNPDRPTDADLRMVLHHGIPGTAMPSFGLLPPDEIDALVEYVKYLSMRGQMESSLIAYIAEELDFDPVTGEVEEGSALNPANDEEQRDIIVNELLADVVEGWQTSSEQVILPEEEQLPPQDRSVEQLAASIEKGRHLFYGERANCVKCHGPTALGDGQQTDHNIWEKESVNFREATVALEDSIETARENLSELSGEAYEEAKLDLAAKQRELQQRLAVMETMFPPRNAIPRNLRQGMFRGGRRPIDLYWRVHQGISGTPMPAGGPASPGAQGTLSDEEIWNLVDYVHSLAYEPASRPQTKLVENPEHVN